MGRIFYIMGKSSSGKDTVYRYLLKEQSLSLQKIVLYTTRPIRDGEKDGREYFFVTEERLEQLTQAGKVMECRTYHTVCGDWHYFTVKDEQIVLAENSYLMIGTIASYLKMKEFYDDEQLVPIYIEADDGIRLERALQRERLQKQPQYMEICRRFLADHKDFTDIAIKKAGIEKRFINDDLTACIAEIKEYILHYNQPL